jgi:hypothetical protein
MTSVNTRVLGYAADGGGAVASPLADARELGTALLLTSGSLPLPTWPPSG